MARLQPRRAGKFNRLTLVWLFNHLAVFIYSVSFILGFGIMLAQLAISLELINLKNWPFWAIGIVSYLTIALLLSFIIKRTQYSNRFELRGNFVRLASMLIVFANRTYYLNFPKTTIYLYEPFILIALFVIFLLIHKRITAHYYYICLGNNPSNLYIDNLEELATPKQKEAAIVMAHKRTIHPRYRDLLDVYKVISRRNGITGNEEYAIFYGMQLHLLPSKKIVPLFKTIISFETYLLPYNHS